MSGICAERKVKKDKLRELYGGMMSAKDLAQELGFRDYHAATRWAASVGLPATPINGRRRYDTDLVARKLVDLRGMA